MWRAYADVGMEVFQVDREHEWMRWPSMWVQEVTHKTSASSRLPNVSATRTHACLQPSTLILPKPGALDVVRSAANVIGILDRSALDGEAGAVWYRGETTPATKTGAACSGESVMPTGGTTRSQPAPSTRVTTLSHVCCHLAQVLRGVHGIDSELRRSRHSNAPGLLRRALTRYLTPHRGRDPAAPVGLVLSRS